MSTPLERYRQDLERDGFVEDAAQLQAVQALEAVYQGLVAAESERSEGGALGRWWRRIRPEEAQAPVPGLYMWGGVGRGKTYLVDTFYDCLPFERKLRIHFHRFMQRVHNELTQLEGTVNPLLTVADRLAREARVLCFDEFFVSDITDAMILGGLMEALFERGVTLVATSNIAPDLLYQNGLQRQRFLPAIALVKQHTRVLNVDGGIDYRLRVLEKAELYHWPLDAEAEISLKQSFDDLVPETGYQWERLEINGRYLSSRWAFDDVVWFEFTELCDGPRSQNDYIELARIYHAVLLGNVPQMGRTSDDQARRFVNLVDEFYDRNVKLIISAEVPLLELYTGGRLEFEFQRTVSRLQEMQSHDYLARSHRP
ncbi:cell division protein ZapE [Halieaceae bacterium IMCC14734]|uniref:Cell division protein ZapE n=1 Tax=Candidatus Litorirhabdus singularis TaxID=2518993 RepID=A0ABT3TK99_9GAMM|nr:cell division protein ZapE [Candidatus Litorirhabdus singularis]MCX2982444.1 cell division protein ZapE [Candidatus Litorirhabdus singularis]